MNFESLTGLVPDSLRPRSRRIFFDQLEVLADIGFHDFELIARQRLVFSIDIWVEEMAFAGDDAISSAWNYDTVRQDVIRIVEARRYNLQETLVRAIYGAIAARKGVVALKVSSNKPDVYSDCGGVGVELSSF